MHMFLFLLSPILSVVSFGHACLEESKRGPCSFHVMLIDAVHASHAVALGYHLLFIFLVLAGAAAAVAAADGNPASSAGDKGLFPLLLPPLLPM